jgi:cytochrome P450
MMIASLLGIPEADWPRLRRLSRCTNWDIRNSEEQMQAADTAAREFIACIGALADEGRAHPQDDLISGLAQYISGNRDPLRFKRADELDLNRKDNPLHTFGLGTHYCPGAPLARLELQVLFKILFQRWPDLRFSDEIEFSEGFVIRGLKSLPIEF